MVIFQLDVVHNWPNKLPQKSMDEKSSPFVTQARVLSFISHKLVLIYPYISALLDDIH
jgi:hypothetical protein